MTDEEKSKCHAIIHAHAVAAAAGWVHAEKLAKKMNFYVALGR